MKLGGYGCFRVAMFLMPEAANEMAWIFIILTSISVVYGAFGAIWQKDLKFINAYSSVSHCGLVIFALLMMNETAMDGAIIQSLNPYSQTLNSITSRGIYDSRILRSFSRMGDDLAGICALERRLIQEPNLEAVFLHLTGKALRD